MGPTKLERYGDEIVAVVAEMGEIDEKGEIGS